MRLHADELDIDDGLVRGLVDRAFPEHAGRGLTRLGDSGSSNALYRLGEDLVVRLPRQPGGGATIAKEQRWLRFVADRVDVVVPAIAGVGEPDLGYPERWAITSWLEGHRPVGPGPARDLARFVTELRAMEIPPGAQGDQDLTWYRGRPLGELDTDFREYVDQCRTLRVDLDLDLDLDEALRVWDAAVTASTAVDSPPAWYHGDLLVENLLVDDAGRLAAVLDFGGLAIGDPSVDLVVAWEALDADGRREFRSALDVDDATWSVSRGWALLLAVMTFPYYGATMPRRCADRLAMARAAIGGT